jgi:hypothetical protein
MWFTTLDISARYIRINPPPPPPPRNPLDNIGRLSIFRILGAQQQENLIDPLSTQHVTHKEMNLGGEPNKHSFQLPKLHPMDYHKS